MEPRPQIGELLAGSILHGPKKIEHGLTQVWVIRLLLQLLSYLACTIGNRFSYT